MNNSVHDIARLQEHIDQKRYESARLALAQRVLDRLEELEGLIAIAADHTLDIDRFSAEFTALERLAYPELYVDLEECGGHYFEGEMGS